MAFRFGGKDDEHENRDAIPFAADDEAATALPEGLPDRAFLRDSLRPALKYRDVKEPEPWQQLPLSTCTAHAVAAALWYCEAAQKDGLLREVPIEPSRLFLHYHALWLDRKIGETPDGNSPVSIRRVLDAAKRFGACREVIWPHPAYPLTRAELENPHKLADECEQLALLVGPQSTDSPNNSVYKAVNSTGIVAMEYANLLGRNANHRRSGAQVLGLIKRALLHGNPVVFNVRVFGTFGAAGSKDGFVALPKTKKAQIDDHALTAVGYDDKCQHSPRGSRGCIVARNSFGPLWGDNGHAHFPYAYMCNLDLLKAAWKVTRVQVIDKVAETREALATVGKQNGSRGLASLVNVRRRRA